MNSQRPITYVRRTEDFPISDCVAYKQEERGIAVYKVCILDTVWEGHKHTLPCKGDPKNCIWKGVNIPTPAPPKPHQLSIFSTRENEQEVKHGSSTAEAKT